MNCPNNKEGYIIPHCYTITGSTQSSQTIDTSGMIQFSSYPELLIFNVSTVTSKIYFPVFISLSSELNKTFNIFYATQQTSADIVNSKIQITVLEADLYHVKFQTKHIATSSSEYNWKAIFCC